MEKNAESEAHLLNIPGEVNRIEMEKQMGKLLKKLAKVFDDILVLNATPPKRLLLQTKPEIIEYLLYICTEAWEVCKEYYDIYPERIDKCFGVIDINVAYAKTYLDLLDRVMPNKPAIWKKKAEKIEKNSEREFQILIDNTRVMLNAEEVEHLLKHKRVIVAERQNNEDPRFL